MGRAEEIADGTLQSVQAADGRLVCVFRDGGRIGACADECPHQAFPLSAGELVGNGELECGCHGARFDLATGAVRRGPAVDPLQLHDVRVEDGVVYVSGKARA